MGVAPCTLMPRMGRQARAQLSVPPAPWPPAPPPTPPPTPHPAPPHTCLFVVPAVEAFDPRAGRWMPRARMSQGRAYGAAAYADGSLWVVGGMSGEQYNEAFERWVPAQSLLLRPPAQAAPPPPPALFPHHHPRRVCELLVGYLLSGRWGWGICSQGHGAGVSLHASRPVSFAVVLTNQQGAATPRCPLFRRRVKLLHAAAPLCLPACPGHAATTTRQTRGWACRCPHTSPPCAPSPPPVWCPPPRAERLGPRRADVHLPRGKVAATEGCLIAWTHS